MGGTGNFTLFLKNLGISNFIILLDYLKNAHEKFFQGFIICHSTWTGFRINLPNEKGAPTSKSEGEIESIHLYMSVPIYLTFFHILPSK